MQDQSDDFVTAALRRLPREMTPPPGLEHATVASLRRAGLLRSPLRAGFNLMTWVLAASIAGIAFVGGSMFATRLSAPEPQPTYALLLYGGSSGDDSATHANRAGEYGAWAAANHASGRVIGGEALGTSVASLAVHTVALGTDSVIVDDQPTSGSDFIGYFLVHAEDSDAAVALARDCPHLKYGGRIVVRRVWPDPPPSVVVASQDTGVR
ncbi:MAG: hypothetical protein O2973_08460 [Gemmatimonadetes bacterium]|nr:hypothetical protein [Gemmatimonadota bacterium]